MIVAAGILFRTPEGKVLLLKRSAEGDAEGLWAFPGGKLELGENASDAAVRECVEEMGYDPKDPGSVLCRRVRDGVDYTTFLKDVPSGFAPQLNEEHTEYKWVSLEGIEDL